VLYYEKKLQSQGFDAVIGVDEAGRGPLAGPVVAAAVVLGNEPFKARIDDSKKLSCAQRERAFAEISGNSFFAVGMCDEKVIDAVNIAEATRIAMEQAVGLLLERLPSGCKPYVIVDGNVKLKTSVPCTAIIRGDSKSKSIASASIVAKVTRDRIMADYDKEFPQYGFSRHKGYPTRQHRSALEKFGYSRIHRLTFCGVRESSAAAGTKAVF